ncbi:MAG: YlxR family protein [Absicoccus porci]|jgi:predicted RNA-binding protein YlxR (DUF448 family)|uniref:YlxR family protein n=1 Tax=Absicoccus porci TaxID=2486576 RepID=A0A3N0I3R5_9FIRM|nr:YlxR family protein [Absicoccus porci]MCI6088036.1 YlxR family protein [Absicoccus porci]MDD6460178.1 YlxR family protein [Absicoccus porci]MDD7329531.1 YlxR family protein [Absicoccus porci]MDY4739439.1 YlxR family protein [Absicoccus porci]MEE1354472.1 YlxR family protein [Absicoccus porci]
MRKVPMRKCVVTQERFPKNELIRIVRTPEQTVEIDPTGKRNGHGAYVSKRKETIEKARKTHILDKVLEIHVPDEIYDELMELVHE